MKAILMNKNTPTIEVALDSSTGRLIAITKEINPEYQPVLIALSGSPRRAFDDWLRHRSISDTRAELQKLLELAGVETSCALSVRNLGLNLSDQYWFKPVDSEIKWEDVNFFQNIFNSNPLTTATLKDKWNAKMYSPNASSNGELYKFWAVKGNERCLFKDSSRPYYQQAHNEVIASQILDLMDIQHVPYTLEKVHHKTYSVCRTFINENTEYVPALYILEAVSKEKNESSFSHFMRCTEAVGIKNIEDPIQSMLCFDSIINNEDRHFGNFGFIRNVETLQYEGMAPIFDNGNSLWYMSHTWEVKRTYGNDDSKPFKKHHTEQIKYISNNNCINIKNLNKKTIPSLISKGLSSNQYMDPSRIEAITNAVLNNIRKLEHHFNKSIDLER